MRKRLLGFAAILLVTGCASQRMSGQQLERVAKDWCLSIRASQVIPVYPLTEDLQPGDVFLVQTPAEEQVRVYLERGFLPLENLVTRLPLEGYKSFYSAWPTISDSEDPPPPRRWQLPSSSPVQPHLPRQPLHPRCSMWRPRACRSHCMIPRSLPAPTSWRPATRMPRPWSTWTTKVAGWWSGPPT